ncbi:MAG: DUF3194 domain-containing protein [Crenarchaeota archaeon]|nr:DUF3194 domain-containing protein [Thermoproteota archaeon]
MFHLHPPNGAWNVTIDFGLPELTEKQVEDICAVAEKAARDYIFSKISSKQAENLDICVEAQGTKPVDFSVEINLILTSDAKNVEQKKLVKEAIDETFRVIEKYLRKLT